MDRKGALMQGRGGGGGWGGGGGGVRVGIQTETPEQTIGGFLKNREEGAPRMVGKRRAGR